MILFITLRWNKKPPVGLVGEHEKKKSKNKKKLLSSRLHVGRVKFCTGDLRTKMSKGEKKKRNSMTWKRGKLHIGVKIPNTRCSEISFIMAFNFGPEEAVILLHSKLSHLTNLIIFYVGYQSTLLCERALMSNHLV